MYVASPVYKAKDGRIILMAAEFMGSDEAVCLEQARLLIVEHGPFWNQIGEAHAVSTEVGADYRSELYRKGWQVLNA